MSTDKMVLIPLSEYEDQKRIIEELKKGLSDLVDGKNVFHAVHYGYCYHVSVYSHDSDLTGSINTLQKLRHHKIPMFNFSTNMGDIIDKIILDDKI